MNRYQTWLQNLWPSLREDQQSVCAAISKLDLGCTEKRLARKQHLTETALEAIELRKLDAEKLWIVLEEIKLTLDRSNGSNFIFTGGEYKCRYNVGCARIKFSYQLPNKENIAQLVLIARGRRILEIAAGQALWAKFLAAAGVDIVCTDLKSEPVGIPPFHPVELIDWYQAVCRYPAAVLLMIWPPRGDTQQSLLDAVQAFQGTDIVFVGKPGNFTGGDDLWELLNKWGQVTEYPVFNDWLFDNCENAMYHFKRSLL